MMTINDVMSFSNDHEAIVHLCNCDPVMGDLIARIGPVGLGLRANYFESLVKSIIGQQLSVKAAATIYGRFVELASSNIKPETILLLEHEKMREVGLSNNKAKFVKDLAEKVNAGELQLDALDKKGNEEVIAELMKVKGIGKWTAEMFLIFSLGRLNVLSLGDAGLQRAAQTLYSIDTNDARTPLEQVSHSWGPFESVASLYLWRAIDDGIIKELGR